MIRGSSTIENYRSLGLGPHLVGKQIDTHGRSLAVCKQLGEGGFSFVYLVRSRIVDDGEAIQQSNNTAKFGTEKRRQNPPTLTPDTNQMVLKITSVHNAPQKHMAEKEAKLLQMLSHPSIVQLYDHGYRESYRVGENITSVDDNHCIGLSNACDGSRFNSGHQLPPKSAQYLILMEYCEGGTAFDAIKRMKSTSLTNLSPVSNGSHCQRFDLPSLVISFGQICNAVSYLHAQRPPIIHRDLKPVNFLIKNGAYKLCDFGSAVMGHTDLRSPESRQRAEEVINKTTTQMFRAPEMVDLYMAKRLTQSTDVWALGCCLYSLAFLRDCFEEGSNLAILSCKYKIPDNNPYGESLVDLIERMLAGDYKERSDMSEVIMCLSALYSNRTLPKRRLIDKSNKKDKDKGECRMGVYRTDGQGVYHKASVNNEKITAEAKKLDPKSAAAKRKKANEGQKRRIYTSSPGVTAPLNFQNFASFDQGLANT